MRKKPVLLLALVLVIPLFAFLINTPVEAAPDDCQCVKYVKNRFGLTGAGGNAKNWDNGYLQQRGFVRVDYPQVGSIVVMEPGFSPILTSAGHVGVVESYNANTDKIRVRGANQTKDNLVFEHGCPNVNTVGWGPKVTPRINKTISFWVEGSAPLEDKMTFTHVNYPDGTEVNVNTNFTKTWRLKNTGTTTWSTSYKVAFYSGDQLGGPTYVNLPHAVAPEATVDVSVNLRTPGSPGTSIGYWRLKNASGAAFGSQLRVYIQVKAVETSACPSYSSTNIVLFADKDCKGTTRSFASVGPRNLADYTFDETASSIYVPSGMSLRVYEHAGKGGSSRCITPGAMYDFTRDYYTSGNTGLWLHDTISSIEVFNNTSCQFDAMSFDGHVNYPNGSELNVSTNFTKTWRLKNTGTSTWTTSYQVYFTGGNAMSGQTPKNLPHSVAPGGTVDVSVNMRTPDYAGTATGTWRLRSTSGAAFGDQFQVSINVKTVQTSACPTYSSSNIVLFDEIDCRGTTRSFASAGKRNLADYSFDNMTSSIHVPSGLSLRVYDGRDQTSSSRCITGSMWYLTADYYTDGNTGQLINNTISSIEVFTNSSCYTPPTSNCPNISYPGAVPFSDYDCKGTAPYYYPPGGWWNLDVLNNNTRSLYVPAGKSVRLYEGANRSGWTKCVSTTLYDMRKDYYSATDVPLVNSNGAANLSSIEVFDNANCYPPGFGCENVSGNSVILFEHTFCSGDRRYFPYTGFSDVAKLDFNDKASSIYIPYGWSIKVWEHEGHGSWSCYNTQGGMWELFKDYWQHGETGKVIDNSISGIQVYNNRYCL